jgi:sugar lactone lactonase YvrE
MRVRLSILAALVLATAWATAAHGAVTLSIFTIAGGDQSGFKGDGKAATTASLDGPAGIVVAPDGTIFVADTINQRVRRIDPAARIQTVAGTGKRGFAGDSGPATKADLQDPTALALAKDGSLFVADTGNSRIRVVRPDGTIATVAGTADQGFSGDGGPSTAAQVNAPAGLALAANGALFFSDTGNQRVRRIAVDGKIATVAGGAGTGAAGDGGPATSAQLNGPMGLAVGADGSLLVADSGNNRIRRVGPEGTITTVAGNGGGGSAGDGGAATAAQLNLPVDVSTIPAGGFFVAEAGGHRIRRVDGAGVIARIAGTGGPRYGGDGQASSTGLLNAPRAVELMPSGFELLVADTDNNRIRYIAIPGQSSRLGLAPLKASVLAPLRTIKVKVKERTRRIKVVADRGIAYVVSKDARLAVRIATKRGKPIRTLHLDAEAGRNVLHLPNLLRRGNRRLVKDHYVVRMTATADLETATQSLELVVR